MNGEFEIRCDACGRTATLSPNERDGSAYLSDQENDEADILVIPGPGLTTITCECGVSIYVED